MTSLSGNKGSISKGSDEAFLYECDPCNYQNIISEAKAYCTVCTEYLCLRCEQAHKGSRASRDHKLLTGKDFHLVSMTTNLPVCDTHKTLPLGTYCEDHDEVICGTCKITDHRNCTTTNVSDQKRHFKVTISLDEALKSLTDLKLQFETLKCTRKSDQTKLIFQLNDCLADMRNKRKTINQTFDKLERKFEKEIKETEERVKKEIDDHIMIAQDALIQISDEIKSLEKCKKSQYDTAMFVSTKKALKMKSKYDKTLSTINEAIYPIGVRFRPNAILNDVITHLNTLGTIEGLDHSLRQIADPLLQLSVFDKLEISVSTAFVFDCTFMKSGHLVLAGGNILILLGESFKVQSQLSVKSSRVAAVNENEVVVTQDENQQLLRVRLFPHMVVTKTVKVDRECRGVDVSNDEIYVACHDGKGLGEVQILNMDGKMQRKLGEYMFERTDGVKVSRDGSKVFVSDTATHKVTCLNQQGHVIYQYSDPDLMIPHGLYVDENDTLLVCGSRFNNIHMVGRDGRKVKVWLTQKDGVVNPLCVSYRQNDGCLVVGLWGKDKPLLVFHAKNLKMIEFL